MISTNCCSNFISSNKPSDQKFHHCSCPQWHRFLFCLCDGAGLPPTPPRLMQWVKDLALLHLLHSTQPWLWFYPWPGNFQMQWVWPERKNNPTLELHLLKFLLLILYPQPQPNILKSHLINCFVTKQDPTGLSPGRTFPHNPLLYLLSEASR